MKKLSDNIIMSDAYCEMTDCRNVESCEKCIELNIAEHDKQIRADAIEEMLSKIWNCAMYVETEGGWHGITVDFEHIKNIAKQLKEQYEKQ